MARRKPSIRSATGPILLLTACGGGRVATDDLVLLIEQPPATIDPRFAVGAYDFKLARLVFSPLVTQDDPALGPQMELAESVVAQTPTEYLVTLREGAQFSDGRPVTADDVIYTINFCRDPRNGSRLVGRFRDNGLAELAAVDARHLRFVLSHPHAPFITDLDVGIVARPHTGPHTDQELVGAGPFVVESSSPDRWRFVPNPHYWRGPARIKHLIVRVIRDDNSRLLALVGGSADLTQNTVSPLLLEAVQQQERLRVLTAPSTTFSYLGLNGEDPILRDVRVRRAIAYALDRPSIIASKLGGHARVATGMLATFHWAYTADVPRYGHDPARARALLDEAGYPDPDGDGPRPRFTLVYKTSSVHFRVTLAQAIAAQLGEVGIQVEVRPLEFATFFADVKAGNFQLFSMQIPEISEPDIITNFFASDRIPTREEPDRGGNRVRYRSARVDALLVEGRSALDRAERRRIYGEIQQALATDLPVIPLWHDDNIAVMGRNVKDYELVPTSQLVSVLRAHKR